MASLTLVRQFPAMEPRLVFRPMSYEDFHDTWSKSVDALHRAILGLIEDLSMFRALDLHRTRTADGEEFLISLRYYSQVLVLSSLIKIKGRLPASAPTSTSPRGETIRSIGSKLNDARSVFNSFEALRAEIVAEAGWHIVWRVPSVGDMVPTASPYQLLYQLICIRKISAAPTDHIARALSSLQGRQYLSLPNLPSGIARTDLDNCGRPTMLFIAATPNRSRIVFGANQISWGPFTAVSAITRRARDIRLQQYVPRARRAFQALRRKEEEALAELRRDPRMRALSEKELKYRSRLGAIERMRSDASFLGGENELGIALRPPKWEFNQGCYLCQGMMGYQSPIPPVTEKQRKSYLLQFN